MPPEGSRWGRCERAESGRRRTVEEKLLFFPPAGSAAPYACGAGSPGWAGSGRTGPTTDMFKY